MIFNYFEVLAGSPMPVTGVGHLKSPKLRDICLSSGIGIDAYNFYLTMLSWSKEDVLKYSAVLKLRNVDKLNREEFTAFDVITLQKEIRDVFTEDISFFIVEKVAWSNADRCYHIFIDGENEGERIIVGKIDRSNFDDVRKMMLQLNFVSLNEVAETQQTFESEAARKLWERAKEKEAELSKKKKKDNEDAYDLGNIISKLCSLSNGYNYFNIFDLTIFQLYDAFFQMSYMRSVRFSERIYSQYGGDHFNYEDWMKPIIKLKRR